MAAADPGTGSRRSGRRAPAAAQTPEPPQQLAGPAAQPEADPASGAPTAAPSLRRSTRRSKSADGAAVGLAAAASPAPAGCCRKRHAEHSPEQAQQAQQAAAGCSKVNPGLQECGQPAGDGSQPAVDAAQLAGLAGLLECKRCRSSRAGCATCRPKLAAALVRHRQRSGAEAEGCWCLRCIFLSGGKSPAGAAAPTSRAGSTPELPPSWLPSWLPVHCHPAGGSGAAAAAGWPGQVRRR